MAFTSIEICAGAGGQAIGLQRAGFRHVKLVEYDDYAVKTLILNEPSWKGKVIHKDLRDVKPQDLVRPGVRVDLLAGGIPCPPFSVAGKQLGKHDERDLFPEVINLVRSLRPRALLIENVKGLMSHRFDHYRTEIKAALQDSGLDVVMWQVLDASQFGVPQRRPRSVLVALEPSAAPFFSTPHGTSDPVTVGEALLPYLAHWSGGRAWANHANEIAPTLVGGSRKHGGADLGPTGAKKAWARLGVNGHLVADGPPSPDHAGPLTLTVEHAAALQGFPPDWKFAGGKTAQYRQVGNAFPPPVAEAVGRAIAASLRKAPKNTQ